MVGLKETCRASEDKVILIAVQLCGEFLSFKSSLLGWPFWKLFLSQSTSLRFSFSSLPNTRNSQSVELVKVWSSRLNFCVTFLKIFHKNNRNKILWVWDRRDAARFGCVSWDSASLPFPLECNKLLWFPKAFWSLLSSLKLDIQRSNLWFLRAFFNPWESGIHLVTAGLAVQPSLSRVGTRASSMICRYSGDWSRSAPSACEVYSKEGYVI